jgi:hypothetical protein
VGLALGSTSLEVDNIAVLHDVFLTLGHDLALGLDLRLITKFLKDVVVEDESLDKGLLEIVVNDTGGLRRLGTIANGPLADFIRSDCEEAAKLQGLSHLKNDLGQNRVSTSSLLLLLRLSLSLAQSKTRLIRDGDRNERVTLGILVDPFDNLGKMLVLLADKVLFRQVDEVDNGLGSQEEKRVDDLNLNERVSKGSINMFST